MAESCLRPEESLLNNRSRRHVPRLMTLPKGNQAKSPPRLQHRHGTAHGPFQRVLQPGGEAIRYPVLFMLRHAPNRKRVFKKCAAIVYISRLMASMIKEEEKVNKEFNWLISTTTAVIASYSTTNFGTYETG